MMKFLVLFCILGLSQAATVIDPSECTSYPCVIFYDEFDFLDHKVWEHEITMAGGGNWEFELYVNNRSISYTNNSVLYIKPDLTENWLGEGSLESSSINLWGMNGRGEDCTGNVNFGCERQGNAVNILNPIMSARMRSSLSFAFKYGSLEVRAQMPRGDWLWPAIWCLNRYFPYGPWPASGEIDLIESRGNDNWGTLGNEWAGSTLHWGPWWEHNSYYLTTSKYTTAGTESETPVTSFADDFHTWRVDWTANDMKFYLDDVLALTVDPGTNFWDFGGFSSIGDIDNPWKDQEKMAPFDREFYLILNLAVGGTGGYFPDAADDGTKPWTDDSTQASLDFWNRRSEWLPTWTDSATGKISETAALKIDYIRVTKTSA